VQGEYNHFDARRGRACSTGGLRNAIEEHLHQICATLLIVASASWCLLLFSEYRSPVLFAPAQASVYAATHLGKSNALDVSTAIRIKNAPASGVTASTIVGAAESTASIISREWSLFEPTRAASQAPVPTKAVESREAVRVASLDRAMPALATPRLAPETVAPRLLPDNIEAKTALVDVATAPFPYHGNMPGTDRPFLNAGEEGHRGHVNIRGRVLWESQTFRDDRVLVDIPPGFDPKRPAVMVVFFHGHGAELARDVRDRQRVPAQINAAGINAVLVAPQFAFDAADSSAGKFWEPNGFKRFLDEAAAKLAKLYGDPRSVAVFARMPIIIVSYSGGYGPTLAVLDRGGERSRVRGVVLLDSLYAGIDQFADWIANNRSTFFVSAYTPHTAYHNADLERLLRERGVPYALQLKRDHLRGTVTFLPTGDISHRDFVTHAWADNPITDVLARMDDVDPKTQTARALLPPTVSANSKPIK
jgi:hypothetical protein